VLCQDPKLTRARNGQIESATEPGSRQNRRHSLSADVADVMFIFRDANNLCVYKDVIRNKDEVQKKHTPQELIENIGRLEQTASGDTAQRHKGHKKEGLRQNSLWVTWICGVLPPVGFSHSWKSTHILTLQKKRME